MPSVGTEKDKMNTSEHQTPPVARAKPFSIRTHGDTRVDNWYWLKYSTDPEVVALLEAENSYTRSLFTHLTDLQKKLYNEIAGRTPETDYSVPVLRGSADRHLGLVAPLTSPSPARPDERLPDPTCLSAEPLKGNWWYFKRTFEGKSYPIHCAIPVSRPPTGTPPTGTPPTHVPPANNYEPPTIIPDKQSYNEIILLDENQLAKDYPYMSIGNLEISQMGNLIAYSVDTTGNEHFTLYIDRITLQDDAQRETLYSIEDVSYGIVFDSDELLYYVKADSQDRPYQVWCHKIHLEGMNNITDPSDLSDLKNRLPSEPLEDTLIYEENDERFFLSISSTKDGRYLLIDARSKTTSETLAVRLINHMTLPTACDEIPEARKDVTRPKEALPVTDRHTHQPGTVPANGLQIIQPRSEGIEYSVEHYNDAFILLTNESAPDFRVISVNEQHRTDRTELVAHEPGRRIEDMDIFNDFLIIQVRKDAMSRVQVLHMDDTQSGYFVEQPPAPSTCYIGANYCMESPYLRYETMSLISPKNTYDLDLKSGQPILRKKQYITGNYDESAYITMHLEATSYDGTPVPISIACSRDTAKDGTAPCLLYGYGAYEHSIDPAFSAARLSLLERGFIFAIAHVRGGGEMGRSWYESGKLASKPNTFHDFIACAQHLISNKWTSPEKLVARGGSAGGMLMGAVANMAPELFRAIVAEVPFVDCLTTMMDPSLPLTITEWEEWGNPLENPDDYAIMKTYSPYDNVRQGIHYPDILATCGLSDPRVGYFEPLKWVQKLRQASPESRIMLMVNMDGGHMGPSGRYAAWDEEAQILAFVVDSVQDKPYK